LKNQNKNKLFKIAKSIFRNSPLLLAILCVLVFFTTFDIGLSFAIWFAGIGADNTFSHIDCAKKNAEKKEVVIKTGGIYLFTYMGMVIVVIGLYLALPFSVVTMSYSNAFLVATLGASLVAVCNLILRRNLANWI